MPSPPADQIYRLLWDPFSLFDECADTLGRFKTDILPLVIWLSYETRSKSTDVIWVKFELWSHRMENSNFRISGDFWESWWVFSLIAQSMEIVLNFIIIVICVFFNHTDGSTFFSHDFYILVPFDCTAGNCSEFDHDIMGSFLSHLWKLFRMKKSLKTNN